ncbi:hypothetical protein HFP15_39975 [Amycolatopsis sp. K13G38]|uniref:Uncharacterized protein n=1 Tax=Amycolatopsis acididurans TaxID=2724524 RepID=A0ABX1JH21_9PSEU|nr:hypothetical protein [Amycolatopsis acididurans]NKQ59039.1 hypothetical protein [Amycolatopsis acididurans]
MTIQLELPAPGTEFPTLDLAELDEVPLRPAVYLSTFEHREFPAALAVALPTVVHAQPRQIGELHDEHEFIDARNGAAVRLVLTYDCHARQVVARIAEAGPVGLWDRIVTAATQWTQDGRPPASGWSPR